MKFSVRWLHEWVPYAPDGAELAEKLTLAGLEVDSLTALGASMDGFHVAEVQTVEPHPNADRLKVCQVSIADGQPLQIVCGAPNARAGMRSILASVGAVMPNGMKIRRSKLRGVESQGMLCSASELGLGDDHDGILDLTPTAPVGTPAASFLNLPDSIVDIDITPNRGDCFSLLGVAREVAAFCGQRLPDPVVAEPTAATDQVQPVDLVAEAACSRFASRVVAGIDQAAATPAWMVEKLTRAGLRPIHPVVDITNFVMLELGQPLHAYDLDKISGPLSVRFAAAGERCVLLDEKPVDLDDNVVVVADTTGPLGMAGIMGGLSSAVSDSTANVLFEAAYWTPEFIAGRARRFGLHTDAALRFERGVDPNGQARAVQRATELLLEIAGGSAGPLSDVVLDTHPTVRAAIEVRWKHVERLLGISIPPTEIVNILERLGMVCEADDELVSVSPPSHRFDIAIAEDVIEEIARVYGYDEIPAATAALAVPLEAVSENVFPADAMRDALAERGYNEVMTYSFVAPELQAKCDGTATEIALSNPISAELSVMRRSLLPGLVTTLATNQARQQERLRFFEMGTCFSLTNDDVVEAQRIGGIASGARDREAWTGNDERVDFFDVKADVDALFGRAAERLVWRPSKHAALHPGQSADIVLDENIVGRAGRLHPALARDLDLVDSAVYFELNAEILGVSPLPAFASISRYPSVRRDLAVLVAENVSAGDIIATISQAIPTLLKQVVLFDIYRGKGVEPGLKSLALGLILQETSRTLVDDEVDSAVRSATDALKKVLGATLREK